MALRTGRVNASATAYEALNWPRRNAAGCKLSPPTAYACTQPVLFVVKNHKRLTRYKVLGLYTYQRSPAIFSSTVISSWPSITNTYPPTLP